MSEEENLIKLAVFLEDLRIQLNKNENVEMTVELSKGRTGADCAYAKAAAKRLKKDSLTGILQSLKESYSKAQELHFIRK